MNRATILSFILGGVFGALTLSLVVHKQHQEELVTKLYAELITANLYVKQLEDNRASDLLKLIKPSIQSNLCALDYLSEELFWISPEKVLTEELAQIVVEQNFDSGECKDIVKIASS